MRIKKNKKAFTIVELVIVIAVIAILAAVLIPTFSSVIQKAKDSNAINEARNAYTNYMIEITGKVEIPEFFLYKAEESRIVAIQNGAVIGVYESEDAALTDLIGEGQYDLEKLNPTEDGKLFAYGGEMPEISKPDEPTNWSGAAAVFVGDSITASRDHTSKFYYEHLQETLNLSSVKSQATANSCISVTSNYATSFNPLINRYQDIPDGDLIVIFMGTNDFGHATPLGTIDDNSDISFYGALNVIIPGIKSSHPNSQIVMITPMHRVAQSKGMTSPSDSSPNDAGYTLADYVTAIKNICEKYGVYTIDLFNADELNPNDASINTARFKDGLHPNTEGHEVMAKIIAEQLLLIPRLESSDTPSVPEIPDVPDVPDVEELNYTLVHGNRFANTSDTNRMSTEKNIHLSQGTVLTLKENSKYDWAVSPENSYDATSGGYLTAS